jgi:transcriptional regulator with XRE-family HTH domain
MTKEELKELRRKLGLNQSEMADKLGVCRAQLNRYENGLKMSKPVEKLAETMI